MKLKDIVERLDLEVITGESNLDTEIRRGYVSDLLSDVIANAEENDIWITLQGHQNIVAVASMKELAGIIIINGRKPEKETIEKAKIEDIPILLTPLPAFELIGRMYNMGISGTARNGK